MLIAVAVIFVVKEDGIADPVGLGLCTIAVGLLGYAKEQMHLQNKKLNCSE